MIKTIQLSGFKSFIEEEIEFGKLTILTGLNSSGKSSIIQSILLLEKANNGDEIYLEGHGNISESQNPFVRDGVGLKCILTDGNSIEIINNKSLLNNENKAKFPEIIHVSADRFGPETSLPINNNYGKIGKRGENILKCIDIVSDRIIPDILIHPDSEGSTFLFNLRAWLGIISPNVTFESFIQEKSDSSYSTFNSYRAKNVGFGLSYSLPVITALLLGALTPNSIVILENPEAHLHPRGQTEIAKLISLCVEAGVQVLVETHSDHLFDGIRLYCKNSQKSFNSDVKIYWFELDKDKNSETSRVSIDNYGRVENWPLGMFDQFSVNSSKLL
ncbi:AAA family ATPase [Pedobacter sp. WC2501]|uniref:AAA family ATPase n=1 Tax=Pedobacter sp. WC2501 TaxID=3461400 RepID=UPI0040458C23